MVKMPHPMPSLIWLTISFVRYGDRFSGVFGFPISAFSICSHSFLTYSGARGSMFAVIFPATLSAIHRTGRRKSNCMQATLTADGPHLLCVWKILHGVLLSGSMFVCPSNCGVFLGVDLHGNGNQVFSAIKTGRRRRRTLLYPSDCRSELRKAGVDPDVLPLPSLTQDRVSLVKVASTLTSMYTPSMPGQYGCLRYLHVQQPNRSGRDLPADEAYACCFACACKISHLQPDPHFSLL